MAVSIRQLLGSAHSIKPVSDSWQLDGELLLASVLKVNREYLFTWPDKAVGLNEQQQFQELVARRSTGEPVAYLLGKQAFWDFELAVNPSVLIPRPETELLVETAIALLDKCTSGDKLLADLGTGSGAIAIALARSNAAWRVTAVDWSEAALAVAQANAEALGTANIEFRRASWCDGLDEQSYDLIVANPPYVSEGDRHLQEGSLPFEPSEALIADDDGLSDIRKIALGAKMYLKKDSWLLTEHGFEQKDEVQEILETLGYDKIECKQDLAGLDRMTQARWPH